MMAHLAEAVGSAERWGPLWGARPRDWAASEEQQVPTYQAAIERVGIAPGQKVLDIGCGVGVFLRLVADRGAEAYGLDASEALLDLARERVPEADLRAGDMEHLPYDDDTFDLVTGFNVFFFARDLVRALTEARRVSKPGGEVVIQVWGAPERNDLEGMKEVARRYGPPPRPGAPDPPRLWEPGVLEDFAGQAGLEPESAFDVAWAYEYPDEESLGRLLMAPMGLAALVGPEREEGVRREIIEALSPHRTADGGYRLRNEFHIVIAKS